MTMPTAADVTLYALQVAAVVIAAEAAARIVAAPAPPRLRLGYWRAVVAACLALPFLPPLSASQTAPTASRVTLILAAVQPLADAVPSTSWSIVPLAILAGALARAAWLAFGLWRLRALRVSSVAADLDPSLIELVTSVAPGADLRVHHSIAQPMTFGVRRPTILVPVELSREPIETQRAALLHEAWHAARRDWIGLLLEQLVRAAFWFHPAVWWALDRIDLAREQLVDDLVVGVTGRRAAYMEALLAFADRSAPRFAHEFARRRHLGHRLRALAAAGSPRAASLVSIGLLVTAVATATLGAASLRTFRASQSNDRVYELGDEGTSAPAVIREVRPNYTEEAKAQRIEGSVTMECVVTTQGVASDIRVTKSLDSTLGLDKAAVDALKQWQFKPGTKDGKPVPFRVHVQMTFTLK